MCAVVEGTSDSAAVGEVVASSVTSLIQRAPGVFSGAKEQWGSPDMTGWGAGRGETEGTTVPTNTSGDVSWLSPVGFSMVDKFQSTSQVNFVVRLGTFFPLKTVEYSPSSEETISRLTSAANKRSTISAPLIAPNERHISNLEIIQSFVCLVHSRRELSWSSPAGQIVEPLVYMNCLFFLETILSER